MSNRYRILPKPFQQAPPSQFQREQVKKELCGATSGFVMLQTSLRYSGEPPPERPYTLQEAEKLFDPVSCHSYLFDFFTNYPTSDLVYYDLVITYDTPDGPHEEVLKIRPDQTDTKYAPTLLLTFYPYDVNNPRDTRFYSYSFSTTNLQWALKGEAYQSNFSTTDVSPDANNGRWIVYNPPQNDAMTPSELCYNRYYVFNKRYSDFSFHIRTVIKPISELNPPVYVYSHVIHLIPVYYDSRYSIPLPLFTEVREKTLPPPYS